MAYQVGNLEVDFLTEAQTAIDNLDAVLARLKNIQGALKAVSSANKLGKIGSGTNGSSGKNGGSKDDSSKLMKSISLGVLFGKLTYGLNMFKAYGKYAAQIVQYAINYNETQNLWQVAMRNNLSQAKEFLGVMQKAYGLSEQTLMNYQAIFKNMLSALGGLSENVSYKLSEQLMQMALDFSSLYNVSIEDAMTKFQAVLSGQVRPIRSISGYDITDNTIFDIYKAAGGDKTTRGLSQIEKRLLRIYAVYTQESETGAIGDMGKTINYAANQLRIMSETGKEVLTWLGQTALMVMENTGLLVKLNATLIVTREIMKALAYSMGYTDKDFLSSMFENVDDSAKNAEESVNGLLGLLSFDKFESLKSGVSSGSVGEIDGVIQNLISQMTLGATSATFEAQKLADEWLNTLGIIKQYKNTETGEIISEEDYARLDDTQKKLYEMTYEGSRGIKRIKYAISDCVAVMELFISLVVSYKIVSSINNVISKYVDLADKIGKAATKQMLLGNLLTSGGLALILFSLTRLITKWDDLNDGQKAGYIMLGLLGMAFVVLGIRIRTGALSLATFKSGLVTCGATMAKFLKTSMGIVAALTALAIGLTMYISGFNKMTTASKIAIPILATLVGLFAGLAVAKAAAAAGIAAPAMAGITAGVLAAGITLAAGTAMALKRYEKGGEIEDGIFTMNKGEMAGKFSDGTSVVANNEHIVNGISRGVYNAMMAASEQNPKGNMTFVLKVDKDTLGQVTASSTGFKRELERQGYVKMK